MIREKKKKEEEGKEEDDATSRRNVNFSRIRKCKIKYRGRCTISSSTGQSEYIKD